MVLDLIRATSNLLILRHAMSHIVEVLLTHTFLKVVNNAEISLVEVLRMQLDRLGPGYSCIWVGS